MPTLPTTGLLVIDGSYDLLNIERGREHLLTAQGYLGGGILTLQAPTGAGGDFNDVTDATWYGAAEARFIPPGNTMRLVLSGSYGASLQITLTPIH